MATIPFPTTEELVAMNTGMCSIWESNFSYPPAYKQELKEKFPDVEMLHRALDRDDQGMVGSLLSAYHQKLKTFKPKQLIAAAEEGKLDELVDRARQAIEFKKFLVDLEVRHFPERIEARRKAREEALASWE